MKWQPSFEQLENFKTCYIPRCKEMLAYMMDVTSTNSESLAPDDLLPLRRDLFGGRHFHNICLQEFESTNKSPQQWTDLISCRENPRRPLRRREDQGDGGHGCHTDCNNRENIRNAPIGIIGYNPFKWMALHPGNCQWRSVEEQCLQTRRFDPGQFHGRE